MLEPTFDPGSSWAPSWTGRAEHFCGELGTVLEIGHLMLLSYILPQLKSICISLLCCKCFHSPVCPLLIFWMFWVLSQFCLKFCDQSSEWSRIAVYRPERKALPSRPSTETLSSQANIVAMYVIYNCKRLGLHPFSLPQAWTLHNK